MKICRKLIAIIMVAALAICAVSAFAEAEPDYPEVPQGYDGYVTITVESMTLGWGYIVEPTLVPMHEGENVAEVTARMFESLGIEYIAGEMENFYLTDVACENIVNGVEPNVPDYIMEQLAIYPAWSEEQFGFACGEWTGIENGNGMLGSYDYSDGLAGWMIAEDDAALPVGAADYTAQAGHVYRWAFSVYGYGMDIGWSDGWGMFPPFDNPAEGVCHADADELYALIMASPAYAQQVAVGGCAYEEFSAMQAALHNLASSQAEIDNAVAALLNALDDGAVEPPVEPTDDPIEPTDTPVEPTNGPVEPTDEPVETTAEPTPAPAPTTGGVTFIGIGIAALISGTGIALFRRKDN